MRAERSDAAEVQVAEEFLVTSTVMTTIVSQTLDHTRTQLDLNVVRVHSTHYVSGWL